MTVSKGKDEGTKKGKGGNLGLLELREEVVVFIFVLWLPCTHRDAGARDGLMAGEGGCGTLGDVVHAAHLIDLQRKDLQRTK